MLQPRKLKYRKSQKGRSLNRKIITKGTEACISELKRRLGKKGRFWLRIFPHKPKTKKPPEVRMGGGKGDVENYVALVRPGTILFEVAGLDKKSLQDALKSISYKLPIKTKIVSK